MARGDWNARGVCVLGVAAQRAGAGTPPEAAAPPDDVKTLVGRLDLERYKATIKGLTQFGDRRQGTERNREAIDWIEAQLKSYGCANTERITYDFQPCDPAPARSRAAAGGSLPTDRARAAATLRGDARADRRQHRSAAAARREAPRAQHAADRTGRARGGVLHEDRHDPSRRDVHRRRAHGRHRLGRGGQRRWLRHRAGDGAGAHLQQPRRADRALDPLRALEQRGDRAERRARLRRPARGAAGQGKSRRARASIPSRNGWA